MHSPRRFVLSSFLFLAGHAVAPQPARAALADTPGEAPQTAPAAVTPGPGSELADEPSREPRDVPAPSHEAPQREIKLAALPKPSGPPPARSLKSLQAAARAKPRDATLQSELGSALLSERQLDGAQAAAQKAVKFAGSDRGVKARGLSLLGRVAEERARIPDALKLYKQSLALSYEDATARRIFQLDEFSDVVPCQNARSIENICLCLHGLLGGTCFVEDDLSTGVKRLRSTWVPERAHVGTSSAFVAVQLGESWALARHLGRIRELPPQQLSITDVRAQVKQGDARKIYTVTYWAITSNTRCGKLGSETVSGLDREYDVECTTESQRMLVCVARPDDKTVSCPVHTQIGCRRTRTPRIHDEFEGVPAPVRARVRAWRDHGTLTASAKLSLEGGVLRGTELRGEPPATGCQKTSPATYRLW